MLADAAFIGFIPVRDLATARVFYAETLGLRVVDAGGPELSRRPARGHWRPDAVDPPAALEAGMEAAPLWRA